MLQVGKMTVLSCWNKLQSSVEQSKNRFALMHNGIFEAGMKLRCDTKRYAISDGRCNSASLIFIVFSTQLHAE